MYHLLSTYRTLAPSVHTTQMHGQASIHFLSSNTNYLVWSLLHASIVSVSNMPRLLLMFLCMQPIVRHHTPFDSSRSFYGFLPTIGYFSNAYDHTLVSFTRSSLLQPQLLVFYMPYVLSFYHISTYKGQYLSYCLRTHSIPLVVSRLALRDGSQLLYTIVIVVQCSSRRYILRRYLNKATCFSSISFLHCYEKLLLGTSFTFTKVKFFGGFYNVFLARNRNKK